MGAELVPKEQNVKSFGLRFVTALFIVPSLVAVAQAQAPAAPPMVYRYDLRAPWNNGQGVFEIGFQRDPSLSIDLARHIQLDSADPTSALISTTSSFVFVQSFARDWATVADPSNGTYYVYDIIPGSNFLDVAQTYRRTVANMADSDARTGLLNQPESFTEEHEYSAIVQIPRERIVRARLFNIRGQEIAVLQNPNYDPSLRPEVHPDTYPLGTFRGDYYAYNLPGVPAVVVTGDLVCETLAAYQIPRSKRSADSAESDSTCAGLTQTLVATIPFNTPAGFATIQNNISGVYPGQYRQWLDVDGDGLADLCVLYVNPQRYPVVNCYRNTRPAPNADGSPSQFSPDAAIFPTNVLMGTLADSNLGASDSWSFVNVTGNPGDIAFCRVIESVGSYRLLCGNFPKSATATVNPVAFQSANLPGFYAGGGQWVSNLTGNGKPAFCFPKTQNAGPNYFIVCSVATGTGFASPIQTPIADLGTPGTQQWVDILGDGTKAYCRVSTKGDALRCFTINKATGSFARDIVSDPAEYDSYVATNPADIWWADVDHDGKADYCHAVHNYKNNSYVSCTLSVNTPFDKQIETPYLPTGYAGTAAMVDIDGDGYPDFCRLTEAANPANPAQFAQMSCLINDHQNFRTSVDSTSPYDIELNQGSVQDGHLAWLTANGQQTAQYCRFRAGNFLACTAIY